jgi:hypothetical protein
MRPPNTYLKLKEVSAHITMLLANLATMIEVQFGFVLLTVTRRNSESRLWILYLILCG